MIMERLDGLQDGICSHAESNVTNMFGIPCSIDVMIMLQANMITVTSYEILQMVLSGIIS